MSKKKAKLYKTKIPPSHPEYPHRGIYKYDEPSDRRFYLWYNIMSAEIQKDGTLTMRCAEFRRESDEVMAHYSGYATIRPNHPDYAELLEAVTKYREARFD